MKSLDVISISEAAREIGCSRTTLYRALDDGRLTPVDVSGRTMIAKDEALEAFEPKQVGRRARRSDSTDE